MSLRDFAKRYVFAVIRLGFRLTMMPLALHD